MNKIKANIDFNVREGNVILAPSAYNIPKYLSIYGLESGDANVFIEYCIHSEDEPRKSIGFQNAPRKPNYVLEVGKHSGRVYSIYIQHQRRGYLLKELVLDSIYKWIEKKTPKQHADLTPLIRSVEECFPQEETTGDLKEKLEIAKSLIDGAKSIVEIYPLERVIKIVIEI